MSDIYRRFVGAESGRPVEIAVYPTGARVEYLTSDVENVSTPERTPELTPEQKYRIGDGVAMSNPANPYSSAIGWITGNLGLAASIAGGVTAPLLTFSSMLGDGAGQIVGYKASDFLYRNPDRRIKINENLSVSPRELTRQILGLAGGVTAGYGSHKLYNYGEQYHKIGEGAQSTVYVKNNPFKRNVVLKESTITPSMMDKINGLPRVVPSKYIGKSANGNYLYEQESVLPIDTPNMQEFTRLAKSRNFHKRLFEGDTEHVYHNPNTNEVMLDLSGNFGIDKRGRQVLYDVGLLDYDEYLPLIRKKGGKLNAR